MTMQKSEKPMVKSQPRRPSVEIVAVCGPYRFFEHKHKLDKFAVPGGRAMTEDELIKWSVDNGHGRPRFEQVLR